MYYVKMSFDGAGNLYDLSVRDEDPDRLLKNTQSVMAGEWLSKGLDKEIASYGYYRKEFYVY